MRSFNPRIGRRFSRGLRLHSVMLEPRLAPALFTVLNVADAGPGSLRQAVLDANAAAGQDTIDFDATVFAAPQTILLPSGQMTIAGDVIISGPGASLLTVQNTQSAGPTARVLDITAGPVSLSGMTITGGNVVGAGGGVSITGADASMTGVTLAGNSATEDGGGVAVVTAKTTLTLLNCRITGNTSTKSGGGVHLGKSANLTARDTTIDGNSASSSGGAIYFFSKGTLDMESCTVAGNKSNTQSSGRGGGGIFVRSTSGTITNSTISGNTAGNAGAGIAAPGGGIDAYGSPQLTLRSCTVTGNTATLTGGGGLMAVNSVNQPITVTLISTIVAGNAAVFGPDVANTVFATSSLVGKSTFATLVGSGNLLDVDPLLEPLADNGGPTLTHALAAGSPAINAGSNPTFLFDDQRGPAYSRLQGSATDIGAFETADVTPSAIASAANVGTPGAAVHSVNVLFRDALGSQSVAVATLGTGDITISGPGGFVATPDFDAVDVATDGSPRTATYSFTPPGGTWGFEDNGTYTVQIVSGEVSDNDAPVPNTVPAITVGEFIVSMPAAYVIDDVSDVDDGDTSAGKFSLREAIRLANVDPLTTDTITFDAGVFSGPISLALAGGQMPISGPLLMTGPAAALTLDAGAKSRHFVIDQVNPGAAVSITGLTLTNGAVSSGDGGAILNVDAAVTLSSMVITSSKTPNVGGGIATAYDAPGSVTLLDSVVTNCHAAAGGGIAARGNGLVTIARTTISGNTALAAGGGVFVFLFGTMLIEDSTISGNLAGSATSDQGDGGGICVSGSTTTIRNSTITGNSALSKGSPYPPVGGGVYASTNSLLLQNCTVAFNSAGSGLGGGIFTSVYFLPPMLESTIISNNSAASGPDVSGRATLAASLVSNTAGAALTVGNNLLDVDAVLLPLADNGGPTLTHLPNPGSPVRNGGSNVSSLANDQRGLPRVIDGLPDIGAVESTSAVPWARTYPTPVTTAGGTAYQLAVTYADDDAVLAASIDPGDLQLTGPGGFKVNASKVVSVVPPTNSKQLIVTYEFTPPGGSWDVFDTGSYTVSLVANEVSDADAPGLFAPAGTLGKFVAHIAGQLVVTEPSDVEDGVYTAGNFSLREAISVSNWASTVDTITFDAAVFNMPQTLGLTGGWLTVSEPVTITGPAARLTLDGLDTKRHFVIDVSNPTAPVSIAGLTLTNGKTTTSNGGAIWNFDAALTLTDMIITKNTGYFRGGAMTLQTYAASLTMTGCTISDNTASHPGSWGGAISVSGQSSVTIDRSTISGNSSNGNGGGIFFYAGGYLTLTNSTVSGNKANVMTAENGGGGLYLRGMIAVFRNCTISGNSTAAGSGGGLLVIAGGASIQNSTIAFNSASGSGGGVFSQSGGVSFDSSIGSNNSAASGPDLFGYAVAKTSLFGNTSGATLDPASANNLLGVDPLLAPLAANGGTTKTHALKAGSPAIDAGLNTASLATDQRGAPFLRSIGTGPDIGAFEDQHSFVVTNDADTGPGSLRQTLLDANANPGADTVTFDPTFFASTKSIVLTTGEIPIADSVSLTGPGAALLTVNANKASRIFNLQPAPGTAVVNVTGLTFIGGSAAGAGGAILAGNESLTIRDCILTGNQATAEGGAVALTIGGKLTLERLTVAGNTASGGGGVFVGTYSSLTMRDCTLSGNSAGNATSGGGGLLIAGNQPTGSLVIRNSTFAGNSAVGDGGGIMLYGVTNGLTVETSTVTGNTASGAKGGGGIAATGFNHPYYGNYVGSKFTVESCIVAGNSSTANANADLFNGNTAASSVIASTSAIGTSAGVAKFVADAATVALLGADFKLGPIANNGGPTMTVALLPGSPCIDAGTNPAGLLTDQRGLGFDRVVGAAADIGAFEVQNTPTPPAKVSMLKINDGSAQRSRVTSLTITFDSAMTLPMNPDDAFQLKRQSDGMEVELDAKVSGNSVVLTFTGGPLNFGSLADGRYTLTALAALINAGNFDGNGDGTPGDDYVLVGTPANGLFRLFGDADGNGTVNTVDFNAFRSAFGGSSTIFDFDNAGGVGTADFNQFRQRFGASV